MATKEVCSAGAPIHYAVFFCTDDGFGIEMEQAMASEGGPAIPDPLALGGSEHEHPGG